MGSGSCELIQAKQQWEEAIPTLLVFDNCEEVELARQYLPVGSGARVLLTSRDTTWKDHSREESIQQVEIITLPRGDSIALLQRLRPDDANTVADSVGDLPRTAFVLHKPTSHSYKIISSPS